MANSTHFRHLGLFIFIILTWSLAWPVNKVGLNYMSPLWYTAMRLGIGTMTMMLFVILTRQFTLPRLADFPLIITIGWLQISLYVFLTNLGLVYIPAGIATLLAYTTPLWVMPLTVCFFNERPNKKQWLGFILAITGIFILLSPWELNWRDKHVLFGTGMLLLASLSWAISMLCARYMEWTKSPLELIPWQLLVGTLPVVLLAWYHEPSITIAWDMTLTLSLVYTGILITGLSYWGAVIITKELPTLLVSLGFLIVPVISILLSEYFLHESINLPTAGAIGLVLMGLAAVVV